MTTADKEDAGTDDKIELRIVNSDGLLAVNHVFPDTSQSDLERAQANLYYVPVNIPFSKIELRETAIRLRILGQECVVAFTVLFSLASAKRKAASLRNLWCP